MYTRKITVLQSFRQPSPIANPFVTLTLENLPQRVNALPFSWKIALLGRYDIFHVHWLEALTASRQSPLKSAVKKTLACMLLVRLQIAGTPIVQTIHNEQPHEPESTIEARIRQWFAARTTLWILLNARTRRPESGSVRLIPHGHYRDWFKNVPKSSSSKIQGRLTYFGLIRDYKNVPALLRSFREITYPDLTLHISGRPDRKDLKDQIKAISSGDQRIKVQLTHVSDRDLLEQVTEAELVVLPYQEMHNSGAAILALSLNRPILVPASDTNLDLQREVGDGWVFTYQPPLTADALVAALSACRRTPVQGSPNLDKRDWRSLGDQLATCYLESVTRMNECDA